MVAKHVFYTGRVQGVGFRYTARQVAAGYDVCGWVRNLPDGRVELLAAAQDVDELDAFLTDLQERSAVSPHIRETESRSVPMPPGLSGFEIRR